MTTGMRRNAPRAPDRVASFDWASPRKAANPPGDQNRPALESSASTASCGATKTALRPESVKLAHDLLPGDDVARQRRHVAVEEHNDHARPGGIERLRRRQEHTAVAVGLVLPMDSSAWARMPKPAVVVDVEEWPALARLLIVRDRPMIGEGRVLERGERDIGAVDRRDAHSIWPGAPAEGAVGPAQSAARRAAPSARPKDCARLKRRPCMA